MIQNIDEKEHSITTIDQGRRDLAEMTMASVCMKLLKSTFILPFVAGNYLRRPQGSQYYDCSISSRVLFLVLVSLVTVFTANSGIHRHGQYRLGTVLILQAIIMTCTMTAVLRLVCLVHKNGLGSVVAKRRQTSTPKLQIVFIWIFGLTSGLYCALFISKQIECFVIVHAGGFFWNVLFYFNVVLILGIFAEMIFVSYFSQFELKQTSCVNSVMFLMLTGNIIVMLYIYFMKRTFLYAIYFDPEDNLRSCIENNSTVSILKRKSHKLLSPTSVEFSLLTITILLEIWSPTQMDNAYNRSRDREADRDTCRSRDMHVEDGESESDDRQEGDSDGGSRDRHMVNVCEGTHGREIQNNDNYGYCERQMSINSSHRDSELIPLLHSVDELEQPIILSRQRWKVSHIATLAVTLTAGLGLIICYTAQAMDIGNLKQLKFATEIYELTTLVIMTCVQLVGFFCLSHYCVPKKSVKPLRPRDYVYLLSAFGLITFHFYETLGGDASTDSSSSILLFKSILSILQDYLQVVFLLQANRCQKSRPSVPLLESILICTMVMNLVYWFIESFLISEFPITRDLKHSIFAKHLLYFIYDVLLPVAVFFRFTSFLEYYATFDEFRS
ncbi:uncharacterized protein [Argopecten irradians]|uniref:uncharacterized protein n=1 Tax=Argopecten irradians TaxID=31199 RepID=UPI00371C6DC7